MIESMVNRRFPVLLAAVALTAAACGGADGTSSSAPSPAAPPASGQPSAQSSGPPAKQEQTREVTLEVDGTGKLMQPIVYIAGDQGTESDATLPWKKTVTLELTPAEQKVGVLLSIIPGSFRDSGGKLVPGECRILVDGEEVATNEGGESMCKHTLH
ncbi:hypothetical protein ACFOWE_19330 [Planomonospora corallina]|uniref:Lipoprotein n=1 Tax=Planomonospora corallina TaxID=1806052 RepID=A0ABV8ID85_9ACTN